MSDKPKSEKAKAMEVWAGCIAITIVATFCLLIAGFHQGAIANAILVHAFLKLYELDRE